MQRKIARRIKWGADLVQWETERHFKKKGVDLPPQWGALVILACFPEEANNPSPASESYVKAFTDFLAADPDLALAVLCYARERRVRFERGEIGTKSERVRRFLLQEQSLFELRNAKGEKELHRPWSGLFESGKPFKEVPVASLQDKEIAAFLFPGSSGLEDDFEKNTETVKRVRQSLSPRTGANSTRSRKRTKV